MILAAELLVEEPLSDEDFDWPAPDSKVVEVESMVVSEVEVGNPTSIPEQFKQAIAKTLSKSGGGRQSKRQAIREANLAEARKLEELSEEFYPVKPVNSDGGLADYLAALTVSDNEIW